MSNKNEIQTLLSIKERGKTTDARKVVSSLKGKVKQAKKKGGTK